MARHNSRVFFDQTSRMQVRASGGGTCAEWKSTVMPWACGRWAGRIKTANERVAAMASSSACAAARSGTAGVDRAVPLLIPQQSDFSQQPAQATAGFAAHE